MRRTLTMRAEAPGAIVDIDESLIHAVVHAFYARVRTDEMLAPVFEAAIEDWPAHLDKLCAFWSSVTLMTGVYKGQPLEKHMRLPGLDDAHFRRWLSLFSQTLEQLCAPGQPANPHGTKDLLPERRVGFDARDVDAALADIGETFDIQREDLDQLLRRIEIRSFARKSGDPRCHEVMSRDLVTMNERADIAAARVLMLHHAIRSLPVLDDDGRLRGIVGLRELSHPSTTVHEAMLEALTSAPDDASFDLIPRLSDGTRHAVVVVDEERRPVGMITQTAFWPWYRDDISRRSLMVEGAVM